MLSAYRSQILEEIARIPENKMPILYQIIHLLAAEFAPGSGAAEPERSGIRGSLKGIWQGCQIDETLFAEAQESLFPYQNR